MHLREYVKNVPAPQRASIVAKLAEATGLSLNAVNSHARGDRTPTRRAAMAYEQATSGLITAHEMLLSAAPSAETRRARRKARRR